MSYRVRIKEQGRPDGRVSIEAASAVIAALRVALRAETTAMSARAKARGPLSRLERESAAISLVTIESGSGTLVWESDASTLLDVPSETFSGLIDEVNRDSADSNSNPALQRALLSLQGLFYKGSPVEWIEFSADGYDRIGKVDIFAVDRIKLSISARALEDEGSTYTAVVGRLLEMDFVAHSFRVHEAGDKKTVIEYEDFFEPLVHDALKQFISARIQTTSVGKARLLSLETLPDVPSSRFNDRRALSDLVSEQGIKPLTNFAALAVPGVEPVSSEEFGIFLQSIRRDED